MAALANPIQAMAKSKTMKIKKGHIAVIGAGAFGGWTAHHLLKKGYDVTLLDVFGPGNSRASSGGDSKGFPGEQFSGRLVEVWGKIQRHFQGKILREDSGKVGGIFKGISRGIF